MDSSRRIERFLADIRRRLIRRAAARIALQTAAIFLALAALAPLLAGTPDHARPARAAALIAVSLLLIAAIVRGVIGPRRRFAGDRAVARFVGERSPELASDLLSTVELAASNAAASAAAPVSPTLIAALSDATSARAATLVPAVLVDRAELRWPTRQATGALVLLTLLAVLAPARMARGWKNLAAPAAVGRFADAIHSAAPLVGDLTITLEPPSYAARPTTTLVGASGDFRAMPGTLVRLETTALMPVVKAFLVLGDSGEEDRPAAPSAATEGSAMVPLEIDGTTLRGQFMVSSATRYRFLVVGPQGHRSIEDRARTIELEADAAPTIELHAPADELDVSGQKRIELAYLADDDHGITTIELVWSGEGGEKRLPLLNADPPGRTAQDRLFWDLAEVGLRPGATVSYWVEARDNDAVGGPNRGESKHFSLRVLSPRERHERLLASQREIFEKLVRLLAGRLTVAPPDGEAHEALARESGAVVVELGTLAAALKGDELADRKLTSFMAELRGRLDRAATKEEKILRRVLDRGPRGPLPPPVASQLATADRAQAAALEDDVLTLADWVDRQDLENLLAMSDEIAGHRKRLDKLMEEYARTGSEEVKKEIERELRALEQLMAEQEQRRGGMAEDVLDQFVNSEALDREATENCLAEVRRRLAAGDAEGARQKMTECGQALDRSAASLEEALGELRGERFGAEEKRLAELENELRDLAQDQREIAGKLDELNKRYAEKATSKMKEEAARAAARLAETADRLERRLAKIPESGLGAFEKEELGAVKTRLGDLGRMLADGDLAEALAMARQAEAGLETIAGELETALDEPEDTRWRRESARALDEVEKAQPLAARLVEELARATPSPAEILGPEELKMLDKLRRAEQAAEQRAGRLGDKARAMADELPGQAGEVIVDRVGKAAAAMGRAERRMKARDPSSARPEARAAAEALDAAAAEARGAARMQQAQGGAGAREQPVRIPGADEYRPPAEFREQLLDAMKRQGEAPSGYGDMLRRYYEELTR